MLAVSTIFQSFDQNILREAVITADAAPVATYDLATLGFLRPDTRVKFDTDTVTITFTLPSAQRGDLFVLPMSNLAAAGGSPVTSPRLTNDAGLDVLLPVPTGTYGRGLPNTLVVDVSVLDTDVSNRTSDEWNLVIAGNPVDVTLGGAVAIYGPKTQLADRDVKWGYARRKRGLVIEPGENAFGTVLREDTGAMIRGCDLETLATDADAAAIEQWFDDCNGRARPGLLWVVDFEDAYLGLFDTDFQRVVGAGGVPDTNLIRLSFTELSKGIPLL